MKEGEAVLAFIVVFFRILRSWEEGGVYVLGLGFEEVFFWYGFMDFILVVFYKYLYL